MKLIYNNENLKEKEDKVNNNLEQDTKMNQQEKLNNAKIEEDKLPSQIFSIDEEQKK